MMLKLLPLTALALGLSSGVALADRDHGGDRHGDHRGSSHVVRDHRGGHGGNVVVRGGRSNVVIRGHGGNWHGGGRMVVRNEPRHYGHRRPIFVSRPVIRQRYYNYYRRPTLIVENYNSMPGYYWVAGSWSWSGFEWTWQPGHYEPDPSYLESGYEPDPSYLESGYDGYGSY